MQYIGHIRRKSTSRAIDLDEWIALIDAHESLKRIPARMGINPFTRKPQVYKPPSDIARVCIGDSVLGRISWARDNSQVLLVGSEGGSENTVAPIAQSVAASLDAEFIREVPASNARVERLLFELCVTLGFCLPCLEQARLCANPPTEIHAFADAVFIAEGMNPHANTYLRGQVLQIVAKHFNLPNEVES